jgi:hypothetical protein
MIYPSIHASKGFGYMDKWIFGIARHSVSLTNILEMAVSFQEPFPFCMVLS